MLASSLEKIFPKIAPTALQQASVLSGLIGETLSFQLAYKMEYDERDLYGQEITLLL